MQGFELTNWLVWIPGAPQAFPDWAALYSIWPKYPLCGQLTLTAMCGPSPNCWHNIGSKKLHKMSLYTVVERFLHTCWKQTCSSMAMPLFTPWQSIKTWFAKVGRTWVACREFLGLIEMTAHTQHYCPASCALLAKWPQILNNIFQNLVWRPPKRIQNRDNSILMLIVLILRCPHTIGHIVYTEHTGEIWQGTIRFHRLM